jgi:glycine cleavage system H protein
MTFPAELKYTKDHEWVQAFGQDAKVGVTDFAIEQLGDIVHVDLPDVGKSFATGASFGTIESTKTVSDLYMPIGGEVVEVNNAVLKSPESLQSDAYKNGWLVKIKVTTPGDLSKLMSAADYEMFISEQSH